MKRCQNKLFSAVLAGCLLFFTLPGWSRPAGPSIQASGQEQQEELTEEEYDAYEKAVKEPDLDKRPEMLLAFMDKYPKSTLHPHIVAAYRTLMYDYRKAEKWDKLEPLAENWLKLHNDDTQALADACDASQKLGHNEKFIQYGLKIYAMKPTGPLAYYIAESYKKTGHEAEYLEWTEKLFSYPEFDHNVDMRMVFVQKYADANQLEEAARYAHLALKALAGAKKPQASSQADWNKYTKAIKRNCNYLIGMNFYGKNSFKEAIQYLRRALEAEKFDKGYYYIGFSQWKEGLVEEAITSFAITVLLKGEMQDQAKEHLESLYKSLHNNTTIGIEKVYRRAEAELRGDRAA